MTQAGRRGRRRVGQPVTPAGSRPQPEHHAPVGWALAHPTGPVVLGVTTVGELPAVRGLAPERIVAIELPLRLADAEWPDGVPLDVVLEDPAGEAASLYTLNTISRQRPVRITIPGRRGLARASRIAMALGFPVRLLTPQPSADVLADLHEVLKVYLHGAQTSAPVEFLQSALAWWLHGDSPPAWITLELDPDWFAHVDTDAVNASASPACEPGFVQAHLAPLVDAGAECASCRFRAWCQGFFKWPVAAYDCGGIVRLLTRVEESAAQLARDLDDARALES